MPHLAQLDSWVPWLSFGGVVSRGLLQVIGFDLKSTLMLKLCSAQNVSCRIVSCNTQMEQHSFDIFCIEWIAITCAAA